jgi:hypothetical protein
MELKSVAKKVFTAAANASNEHQIQLKSLDELGTLQIDLVPENKR